MTVGDIFENTAVLVGRTFVRNFMIALVFLIIPTAIIVVAEHFFYHAIYGGRVVLFSFLTLLPLLGLLLIVELGVLLSTLGISYIVGNEMMSHTVTFREAIRETVNRKWIGGLGQALLKYGVVGGGLITLGIIFGILDGMTKYAPRAEKGLVMLFQVPFFLLLVPTVFYLFVKWLFSMTSVAVEDTTAMDSLRKSWRIVDGYWWRTLGIFVLLAVITHFAITLITIPVKFGSMWTVYRQFYSMLGKSGGQTAGASGLAVNAGLWGGIGTMISGTLSLFVTPVFTVVMYFDLRARQDDFQQSPGDSLDAQSPSPAI